MPKMTAIRKSVQKASGVPSRVLQRQNKPAVPLHPVLRLQQTAGNQAVGRLIQAKLKVGQPEDKYEQEADRVAEQILSRPASQMQRQAMEEEGLVQRQTEEDEEVELHRQSIEEEEETPQAKEGSGRTPEVTPKLQSRINRFQSGGQPLPKSVRTFFESRFGYDFGNTRIHTDAQVAETAQMLNAQAFTIGQDIMFGTEQYAPETTKGRRLLAHELTHVIQQQDHKVGTSLQRYTIPSDLKCNQLVDWMNTNSPYSPEWAQTSVEYEFDPPSINVRFKSTRGGTVAKAKADPKTKAKMMAPIDMPQWKPSKRPNRRAELKAWNRMLASLRMHEREHRHIGRVWQGKLQKRMRKLSFTVKSKDRADAETKAINELRRREGKWKAEAQAAQDKFDMKTNHGKKAIKRFPAVKLKCP